MDFLVERPPREVLDRAQAYLLRRRFRMALSERTDTTALFARVHIQRKGCLRTLLGAFVTTTAPLPKQRVWLIASEAGEGRTRLTTVESMQGEWPDEWLDVQTELERWVIEELGARYWPA